MTKRVGGVKDETVVAWIAYQITKGLKEIHSSSQIHRDIKPSNILINSLGQVKVGRFSSLASAESARSTPD